MTRTQKFNSRDHQAVAEGMPRQHFVPKFFGKSGFADQDPTKTKKNGGGKGNWGSMGGEMYDEDFNFHKTRRRSNSSSVDNHIREFKTKWEVNETDPVFEEDVHGAENDEDAAKSVSSETGSSST